MAYKDVTPPKGAKISIKAGKLNMPDNTVKTFKKYLINIKGPLTTPINDDIRSLNVALHQILNLYIYLQPVQYFQNIPSPVKHPEKIDMIIFRKNTENIYAKIDYQT